MNKKNLLENIITLRDHLRYNFGCVLIIRIKEQSYNVEKKPDHHLT